MTAHTITATTILGFAGPGGLKYVTKNYEVANLATGEIVSTGGPREEESSTVDAYTTEVASHTHAVYGRDIAAGIGMTVAKRTAKPSQNIGIAITMMRVGGPGNSWSIVDTLAQSDAVRLMHKWYIEHGLMDLYMRNKYTAISGFQEWVCGKLIEFFTPNNKFQWYGHVMDIDYEMEEKGCEFTECLCDTKVPSENRRHVVPNQLYDRFGLIGHATRMALWANGKPETEEEANMILHRARQMDNSVKTAMLMEPIEREARRARAARRAGRELDRKAVQELLDEGNAIQEKQDKVEQRKEDTATLVAAFTEKHSHDKNTGGGGKCRRGITWAGPVKYVDPFRRAEEGARLAAHEAAMRE